MKQRSPAFRFLCGFLTVLLLCTLPLTVFASDISAPAAADLRRAPYVFAIDQITGGTAFGGASTIHIYEDYVFPADGVMTVQGWIATDEGISHYEYAWVSADHSTPVWQKASNIRIMARPDLAAAGIPYPGGHGTAGFSLDVLPPEGAGDGYYDLYIRAVTGDGIGCDLALFSHMMYGTPDYDDGEKRIISFPRLVKTQGALVNATADGTGLIMTNTSVAALGNINLGAFERVTLTYSLSQSYTADRQALVGFKSSPDRLYGDGEGQYDLTDHITALPLITETTVPQTVELDLTKVNLVSHESLYLSIYLRDGVTLILHEIMLTYRGQGYDRTAAKIFFSSDVTDKFTGVNKVSLKGFSDPVMGEVLRIEVTEETNDPYTHFNAWSLMSDYDISLTADDYKYMVVLARASAENQHSSMTFYLCAGSIYSATEACTYSHTLKTDGQWHYYVFDLTSKENWKGGINGWRFDIINGDSAPGNYVDFASIQFFRTPEAAAAAASTSVSDNITPHALGMPAVIRDDVEGAVASNEPVIFEEGDWFEETTVPETEPETVFEGTEPVVTLPSEETETTVETTVTASQTDQVDGCSSLVAVSSLTILMIFPCIILKRKRSDAH